MGHITETNVVEKMKEHPKSFLSAATESISELIRENGQKDRDILKILYEYRMRILTTMKECVEAIPEYELSLEGGNYINDGWIEALKYSEKQFSKCLEEIVEKIAPSFNPKREDQEMEGKELMEEYGEVE